MAGYNPVNTGAAANDNSGDPLRDSFIKSNGMLSEVFSVMPYVVPATFTDADLVTALAQAPVTAQLVLVKVAGS